MPRHMSFSMTTDAIRDRTKTVTRRVGWKFLKPGDILWAVEKGQGLKKGEKVNRLALIKAVTVRRECLDELTHYSVYGRHEMVREGFPGMFPCEFVALWCERAGGVEHQPVTRIEFEYIEDEQ